MRRLIFLLLAAAGCAAAPAQTAPTPQTIIVTDDGVVRTNVVEGAAVDSLPVAPDAGMRAMLSAYERLGITVSLVDPAARRIGNPSFTATRVLNGIRLSTFVSCGQTQSGLRADENRIYLSIVSALRPTSTGRTLVETRLEASAVDIQSGNTADRIPCGSTGVLETRIHDTAKKTTPAR